MGGPAEDLIARLRERLAQIPAHQRQEFLLGQILEELIQLRVQMRSGLDQLTIAVAKRT